MTNELQLNDNQFSIQLVHKADTAHKQVFFRVSCINHLSIIITFASHFKKSNTSLKINIL